MTVARLLIAAALWIATPAQAFDFATQRAFHAELAAKNMTTLTDSPGTGHADFLLDLPTLTLHWTIGVDGLTSPATKITLHAPAQPGTNFPAMLDLSPKGARPPIKGEAVLTEAQVQYLLQNWAYVLVSTTKNPNGEIRGKLVTVPPSE